MKALGRGQLKWSSCCAYSKEGGRSDFQGVERLWTAPTTGNRGCGDYVIGARSSKNHHENGEHPRCSGNYCFHIDGVRKWWERSLALAPNKGRVCLYSLTTTIPRTTLVFGFWIGGTTRQSQSLLAKGNNIIFSLNIDPKKRSSSWMEEASQKIHVQGDSCKRLPANLLKVRYFYSPSYNTKIVLIYRVIFIPFIVRTESTTTCLLESITSNEMPTRFPRILQRNS